jgi:hypothetical protein
MEHLPGALPETDGSTRSFAGSALERRRAAELTPAERATRRRNRRWMAAIVVPAVLVGTIALIATLDLSSAGPSVRPALVPAGYKAVTDGYFAYAVPAGWSKNLAYSDDVGDLDTSGPSGWVAEHVGARPVPPTAGETPPQVLAAFGEARPQPYKLGPPAPVAVRGASTAFRYALSRPGGFTATAIDAWVAQSGAEVWLLIHADPLTTATVVASLRA